MSLRVGMLSLLFASLAACASLHAQDPVYRQTLRTDVRTASSLWP